MGLFRRQGEISVHITPDAVNVIRRIAGCVGLSVDKLDQERLSLNAVIVADAGLRGPGPGKVHVLESILFNLLESQGRHLGRNGPGIGVDQLAQHFLLLGQQLSRRDARGRFLGRMHRAGVADFLGSLRIDNGTPLLFSSQRLDQLKRQFLFVPQNLFSLLETEGILRFDDRRVRGEELRRAGDHAVPFKHEVNER